MIRDRLRSALDWRVSAITARLDALAGRTEALDRRLQSIAGQLEVLTDSLGEARRLTVEQVSETRAVLEQRIEPALRAVLDEEAENRRRLHRVRERESYEQAYTDAEPLVSATIATVGRDALLERALPSLLAQTYTNLEVIVVGDAAPGDLAGRIASLGDRRLRYTNLSHRLAAHPDPRRHWLVGSTMARNEATRLASGGWLLHFDDDDHLREDAVSSLLTLAREEHAEVSYGGFAEHHPQGRSSTGLGFPPRLGCFSWAGALVHAGLRYFERELVASHLGLPGDMYLLERMLRSGVRFALLDRVVLDYYPSTLWQQPEDPASE